MSLAGVDGADPARPSATGAPAPAPATGAVPATTGPSAPGSAAGPGGGAGRGGSGGAFDSPELTSGLLSDNITPVQREGLGRLGRLLRMAPKEVLAALRSGTNLGVLLAARHLRTSVLVGRFDKGLLIDAEA